MAGIDFVSGAGFAEPSRLVKAIGYEDKLKMPPAGKLPAEQIGDFEQWVKMGAPWPGGVKEAASSGSGVRRPGTALSEKDRKFWSFQPVAHPTVPTVKDALWPRSTIDRFILAKMEEKGLKPAQPADKLTLLRRATFDLTGLPPTGQEMRDFLGAPPFRRGRRPGLEQARCVAAGCREPPCREGQLSSGARSRSALQSSGY